MTTTSNLGLSTYDTGSGSSTTFLQYRLAVDGLSSNATIIDSFAGRVSGSLTSLDLATFKSVNATQFSSNYYKATVGNIRSYAVTMVIILKLDVSITGATTININSLGDVILRKIGASGNPVDLVTGDLIANQYYYFIFNGTYFILISGGGSSGSGASGSSSGLGEPYIVYNSPTALTNSKVITAGSNIAISYSGSQLIISSTATSGSGGTTYTGATPISITGSVVSLATSGVTSGSYNQVQVDAFGRVIAGSVVSVTSGSFYTGASSINVAGSVISHNTSGVSAGTYLAANITIDNKGHITSAANGVSASSVGASSDSLFVTTGSSSSLTNYSVLTAGSNISIVKTGGSIIVNSTATSGSGSGFGFQTLTDGSIISWNLANGSGSVTISGSSSGSRILGNPTNLVRGGHFFLEVSQGGSGNQLLNYGTSYKFSGNIHPSLSTYPGTMDMITFECDGNYMLFADIYKNLTNQDPALTYLTNQLMWLKADDGVFSDNGTTHCGDSDTVYLWQDHSGNANDAIQTSSGNRPTFKTNVLNGKPIIRFNGSSNQFVIDTMNGGDNVSFFIVIVPSDTSPVGLIDTTAGATPPIRNDPAGNWDWYYYSPGTTIGLINTSPVILEFIHSQSSGRHVDYYKNGNLVSQNSDGNTTPTAWGNPRIGSNNDGDEGWYYGDIAEYIIYSETISSSNRSIVETYLKAKYGIV